MQAKNGANVAAEAAHWLHLPSRKDACEKVPGRNTLARQETQAHCVC